MKPSDAWRRPEALFDHKAALNGSLVSALLPRQYLQLEFPACEVADMVLERDNITSVTTAIWQGRAGYRNLKRALRYFITVQFSDMLLATAASAIGPGAALFVFRPVQANLLADLTPGLALLLEPASPSIEREAPRCRQEPLFSNQDIRALLTESAVLAGGAMAAFGYGLMRYEPGVSAATLAYESLSTAKVLHALTCRTWTPDAPKGMRASNPPLNTALAAALIVQAGTLLIPGLRRLLKIAPLNLADLVIIGTTALITRSINRKIRAKRRMNNALPQRVSIKSYKGDILYGSSFLFAPSFLY